MEGLEFPAEWPCGIYAGGRLVRTELRALALLRYCDAMAAAGRPSMSFAEVGDIIWNDDCVARMTVCNAVNRAELALRASQSGFHLMTERQEVILITPGRTMQPPWREALMEHLLNRHFK